MHMSLFKNVKVRSLNLLGLYLHTETITLCTFHELHTLLTLPLIHHIFSDMFSLDQDIFFAKDK